MDRTTRRLLWTGPVATALFAVVFLVDGATRSGYEPGRHPVSALALGSRGWIQIANFVVTGALVALFAVGVRRRLGSGPSSTAGPLLLALFALGLVASGVFVMDPMLGYPTGAPAGIPDDLSWHNQLHDAAGLLVFVTLPAAAFVFARRFRHEPVDRRWAIGSMVVGVAVLVLFVAFGVAFETEHERAGLVQRALIITGWAWLGLLGARLARRDAGGGR